MSVSEVLRPERGSALYWETIGHAWQEDAPLRERQARAAWQREHFRCGGCAGPATRRVACDDGDVVPLCDSCTPGDAIPLECDWSGEHKAARAGLPFVERGEPFSRHRRAAQGVAPETVRPPWFSFSIPRERWLHAQGAKPYLEDATGRGCAAAHYMRARWEQDPKNSYRIDSAKCFERAYDACAGLHPISAVNEDKQIDDAERERRLIGLFHGIGVVLEFTGSVEP